jgi:hypothetical protein
MACLIAEVSEEQFSGFEQVGSGQSFQCLRERGRLLEYSGRVLILDLSLVNSVETYEQSGSGSSFSTKTYEISSHGDAGNWPLLGSTRTTRPSHWRVSCSKFSKVDRVSIEYALSVSKKIPDVLISHVVPIPSFDCTDRASLKRCPLRLSSKPPVPPTVRRTMPVIPGENK